MSIHVAVHRPGNPEVSSLSSGAAYVVQFKAEVGATISVFFETENQLRDWLASLNEAGKCALAPF